MFSFRKRILLSDLILLLIFILLLFPLVGITVNWVMRHSLTERADQLIVELKNSGSVGAMVQTLQRRSQWITLMDKEGNILYSSYPVGERRETNLPFGERFLPFFEGKFYFVSLPFTVDQTSYFLQLDTEAKEIDQLKKDFEIGIWILSLILLIFSTLVDILVAASITRPIQKIIEAIRPFQEKSGEELPRIMVDQTIKGPEFSRLAITLNSLSDRIHQQIEDLKRQRRETEEILESLGEGVIAVDTSAKVTFVNRTACRMLGLPSSATLKQSLPSIHSTELTQKCHELILHALQTSESSKHTWMIQEASPRYLDLISAPLAHLEGALLVLQDKTSDYKVVEMGKDFIANASHELRTPITIIRGFAETLQDLPALSQEMLHEITEKIVRTCRRLDKLVRSLLTLADVENLSEERFKTADFVSLVDNCKHLLVTAHPQTQISFKSELASALITSDYDLMELAVFNILDNAVKYSSPPARIEMILRKVGGEIHLSIRDQGIGIPEADLPHIFDRFYTVDRARSRKSGGAGLGLSIVKTVIEKHQGKTTVSSELEKGSVFTIELPLIS